MTPFLLLRETHSLTLVCTQVEEKTKLACQPEGFYGPLTDRELVVSILTCVMCH